MRIAVTGANGFVGRHVVHALKSMNADVVSVVRPGTENPQHLSGTEIVKLDMADSGGAFERMGRPDALLHLAWGGLPNYLSSNHVKVELPIQRRFLKACVDSGLRRMVVTGTCLEYGMLSGELREDMANNPTTAYGMAKDQLRRDLQGAASARGTELIWLRLFYLYGPGQAPSSLYSQLAAAVARGDAVFDMSPGDQVRDFLAIEDAALVITRLTAQDNGTGIINVCSGQPTTIHDIVHEWVNTWNATISIRLGTYPYPDYEPFAFWGSRTKLNNLLGPT